MKKVLFILTLGILGLNASLVSLVTGENVSSSDYESKERGIIVKQDIDGDGIIDSQDDCLETIPCKKEGCQKVEKKVVVLDSDGDGVNDDKDECPNTPKGFKVDEVGCSKLVNLNVLFDYDKDIIKEEYTDTLTLFINFMKKHTNYKAEIQGHTDSKASETYNQVLSEKRANKVREFLIENGIEESRLSSNGYGEINPIDTNETDAGRANNRRVIAVFEK